MSYAEKFVKSQGQDCEINRMPPFPTKVSIKRSTKASRDLGIRAGYWEGLIPIESKLLSGEIITITNKFETSKYIIQNTNYDSQSDQIAFFSAKCNVLMTHKRYIEDVDDNWNPIQEWKDINVDVSCYGEIINSRMRQENPGLLEGTIYLFQVPKSLGIIMLDRIIYAGKNYQVVSIDPIGLDGVLQIQLGVDLRPD